MTPRGVGIAALVLVVSALLAWLAASQQGGLHEGFARAGAGATPIGALPEAERARAESLLAEPDAAKRAALLRELSRASGAAAVPFLASVLERDPEAGVRARAVKELGRHREPRALDALEAAAARDASVEVSLRALAVVHEARARKLVALLEERMQRPGLAPSDRERLERAHDHRLALALDVTFPEFLREPPPVFAALPPTPSVRVLAFGDFGTGGEPQKRTARAIARAHALAPFSFGITLGDNFYPSGMRSPGDPRWRSDWAALYDPLGIPFYPSLGNHDWKSSASPAAEVLFRSASWNLPAARYTFTAGPAQFFVLDTSVLSPRQLGWLRGELERSRASWKIVYGHHPIRLDGRYGEEDRHVAELLPVLRGRADLYLAGHDHEMQYLAPENGVHLAVIGSGGADIRPARAGARTLFCASRNGFGVLEIEPASLTLRFVDTELETLYETRLERQAGGVASSAGTPVERCLEPLEPIAPSVEVDEP